MPTQPETRDSIARTVDDQFLALLCSEEDLLRSEFDAIIAAEWPSPPASTPRRGAAEQRPAGGTYRRTDADVGRRVAKPRHPGISGWAWQRSPPWRCPTADDRKGG
jgi:hypothetical protein